MREAAELAESTQILMNVSEFTDVSAATDSLISSIQAFKYTAEESMDVVDILNEIGNNYAISTDELASSLTKSSGALVAANGTLEEAVALTATANTIIQDSDVVGTALKTTSMRLRGTDVKEMEEEGLDTEGAITSKSKLRSKVQGITGVDILTEEGAYKSTYEILLQIAEVWEDISDIDQAALLEMLAGKRNASVLSAILQNPDTLKDAFESANNASGSAAHELETYLDSIQGKMDQFNNAVQTMWNDEIGSGWVKFFVDLGKSLVHVIDALGLIPSLLVAISAGYMLINKVSPITFLGDISNSILNTGTRLKGLATSMFGTAAATSALNAEILELSVQNGTLTASQAAQQATTAGLVMSQTALTASEASQILTTTGMTQADALALVAKLNLGKETQTLTAETLVATMTTAGYSTAQIEAAKAALFGGAAAKTAAGGFAALWAAMWPILALMAGVAAIYGVVKLFDALIKTSDELREELDGLKSEVDALESELESLESELETVQDRMEELLSKDSLSFTEEEELKNLQLQNELLEKQIKLQDLLLKSKQKEMVEEAEKIVEADWNGAKTNKKYKFQTAGVNGDSSYITEAPWYSGGISGVDALKNGIDAYDTNKKKIETRENLYVDVLKQMQENNNQINEDLIADVEKELGYSSGWFDKQYGDVLDAGSIEGANQNVAKHIKSALDDTIQANKNSLQTQAQGIDMVFSDLIDVIPEDYEYGTSDIIDEAYDTMTAFRAKYEGVQGMSNKSSIINDMFDATASEEMKQLKKDIDKIATSNDDMAKKTDKAKSIIDAALQSQNDGYKRLKNTMDIVGMSADDLAKSFVAASKAPDIGTIGGVLEVFADGEEILKSRLELANQYNELVNGNVDYSKRPFVSPEEMKKVYPEFDGEIATTWDSDVTYGDGKDGIKYTLKFTPILEDGTVLDQNSYDAYISNVFAELDKNNGDINKALEYDAANYNILINWQEGAVEYDENGESELDRQLGDIKNKHWELQKSWNDLFKEVDGNKVADELKVSAILEGADEDVRNKFIKIIEEVENGKKTVNQAVAEWEMAGIDKVVDVLNTEFETLNNEMFPDAEDEISGMIDTVNELSSALESVAGAMDLVHTAQTQMSKSGRISVKTALEIMQSTEDWDKVLNITEGSITLLGGAEQVLIQTQLDSIKKQTEAAATMADKKYQAALLAAGITELEHEEQILTGTQKQVNQTTNEGTQQMAGYEASTDNAVDAEYDHVNSKVEVMTADAAKAKAVGILAAHLNLLADIVAAIGSERTLGDAWSNYKQTLGDVYATADASMTNLDTLRTARNNRRDINKVMSNVDNVDEFKDYYDYDKTPGDKYDDDGDGKSAFETMQERHEREIALLEHRQDLIQGDIDILEAQHKGVSSEYYKKLISGENQKIDAYERQLKEAQALLANTSKTSEEYNDIVEHIWDIEKGLQDATVAAIEFGEAMNDNFLKSVTDLGDAYENLYNINDRQKGSLELYKEGVEIGGGQVNERWYDDMIAKTKEAGELAQQELQDSLGAIDLWRNAKNPFEAGTEEFKAFEYDRNTKLQEAWAQAADAKDKIQETDNEALQLAEDKKDAYIEAWENVATGFERIGQLFEDQISLIDGYEGRLEALNINVSDAVYQKKIGTQKSIVDNLDEAIAYDEDMLAEYAAKYGTNDERYISKWEELNEKRVQRYEAETEIIQIEQQIIDNQIDRFNQTIDRMNDAVDRMKNISGLVSDEDVADENGDWTAEGLTQAGMAFQEMSYQKEMIAAYAEQMEELTELYNEGKISEKEYYEQMKELEDGQWSAINAYKEAEDSIIELQEARIDMIENGLQEEIDAYAELIEMKKEELDAERDLFEFRRDVEDQSKNIAEIERRMASISNSSSDEDRAEYKRLQKELYDANRGLDDTYRNHSYDQTSQALDEELEAFEKNYDDYIQGLRDELENTDELIKQIYSYVVTNGQIVFETLVQLSDEHGFTLDTNLTAPWKNANGESLNFEESATEHYNNIVTTVELGTAGFVDNIAAPWKKGQEESTLFGTKAKEAVDQSLQHAKEKQTEMSNTLKQPWLDAKGLIDQGPSWVSNAAANILKVVKQNVIDINKEYAKITMPSVQKSAASGSGSGSGNGDGDGKTPYVPPKQQTQPEKPQSATVVRATMAKYFTAVKDIIVGSSDFVKKNSININGTGYYVQKSTNPLLSPDVYYPVVSLKYKNGRNGGYYIPKGTQGYRKYAKGTLGTSKDEWAFTDESWIGEEITLAAGKNGQLQYLKKGSAVIPADISANLVEWGKMNPADMNGSVIKAFVPNIETNTNAVSVNFEALVKADNITNDVLPEVEKLVEKQLNNFTRTLNYSLKRAGAR